MTDIAQELAKARHKLEKTTNLIDEMGAERLTLLKTLDRVHRLGEDRQVFFEETLRLKNKIQELEEQSAKLKISEN